MLKHIDLDRLKAAITARPRPPGCLDELLALGTVDRNTLIIDPAAYETWRKKFATLSPPSTINPQPPTRLRGLGDAIAILAKPIARAVDHVAGTRLETCGGCQKRQAKLNAILPFKTA